jgi:signal transduction histidine kinase
MVGAIAVRLLLRPPEAQARLPSANRGTLDDKKRSTSAADRVERLREENATLRAAVQARDDFISVAAHELRNPMTPLVGQIELLRRNARIAGEAVPAQIMAGIERLDVIVSRYIKRTTILLDISRLTTGKFRLVVAPVDVSTVVSDVVDDFSAFANASGVVLSAAIEPRAVGLFDRTAVEEIVENLTSNAIKYGLGQPVHVGLTCQQNEICLQVEDHGPGISSDDQARIFDQFERLVTARSARGFGLGLWVVGQLVVAMGGTITVDSKPGAGSTFIVRLPLRTTAES